uniref:Uncharacterized protein n=1 Tax=Arundo donax TaxID=35708 RepID=A0A0A9U2E2_ARUDO
MSRVNINKQLSPAHFDWAKKFLASRAWPIVNSVSAHGHVMHFQIPPQCPKDAAVRCPNDAEEALPKDRARGKEKIAEEAQGTRTPQHLLKTDNSASTSALHIKRKAHSQVPLVDTNVRRSLRLRNGGFKKTHVQTKIV